MRAILIVETTHYFYDDHVNKKFYMKSISHNRIVFPWWILAFFALPYPFLTPMPPVSGSAEHGRLRELAAWASAATPVRSYGAWASVLACTSVAGRARQARRLRRFPTAAQANKLPWRREPTRRCMSDVVRANVAAHASKGASASSRDDPREHIAEALASSYGDTGQWVCSGYFPPRARDHSQRGRLLPARAPPRKKLVVCSQRSFLCA